MAISGLASVVEASVAPAAAELEFPATTAGLPVPPAAAAGAAGAAPAVDAGPLETGAPPGAEEAGGLYGAKGWPPPAAAGGGIIPPPPIGVPPPTGAPCVPPPATEPPSAALIAPAPAGPENPLGDATTGCCTGIGASG